MTITEMTTQNGQYPSANTDEEKSSPIAEKIVNWLTGMYVK
jgi:hypothetical protein